MFLYSFFLYNTYVFVIYVESIEVVGIFGISFAYHKLMQYVRIEACRYVVAVQLVNRVLRDVKVILNVSNKYVLMIYFVVVVIMAMDFGMLFVMFFVRNIYVNID